MLGKRRSADLRAGNLLQTTLGLHHYRGAANAIVSNFAVENTWAVMESCRESPRVQCAWDVLGEHVGL